MQCQPVVNVDQVVKTPYIMAELFPRYASGAIVLDWIAAHSDG